MSSDGKVGAAGVQTRIVSADEAGMRLDRWFKLHFPAVGLSYLNKILRKGEVRVDGKRVEGNTRLTEAALVRVPPLRVEAPVEGPVKRPYSESDARAIKQMVLFEDKWLMVLNKPYGLAVQGGSGTTHHIDGMLDSLTDARGEIRRDAIAKLCDEVAALHALTQFAIVFQQPTADAKGQRHLVLGFNAPGEVHCRRPIALGDDRGANLAWRGRRHLSLLLAGR